MSINKVGFFYRDYLKNGGVPKDVEGLANAITSKNIDVYVYCVGGGSRNLQNDEAVIIKSYKKSLAGYIKLFSDISKNVDRINIMHVFVLFIPINWLIFLATKASSIPIVITPNCVLHKIVMEGKLFYSNKGVAWLGDQGGVWESFFSNKMSKIIKLKSILQKNLFLKSIGKKMMLSADGIHYASSFEKLHSESYTGRNKSESLVSSWPSKVWVKEKKVDNYSGTNFWDVHGSTDLLNIVFWSRIDYYYKGIDLILEAINLASKKCELKVVIYLIGPDYQNGLVKVSSYISDNNLDKYIKILDFESIYPSVSPLAQADANIVLSRCDGVLRSVRESLNLGIPQIISEGTQFGDVIEEYNAGFVVKETDGVSQAEVLSSYLVAISLNTDLLSNQRENAIRASKSLEDGPISDKFISFYNLIVCK